MPYVIGLAIVLVALPMGRKAKQKIIEKFEQRKERRMEKKKEDENYTSL